jgi:hypothetical protein
MKMIEIRKSGRSGDWVYYLRGKKLCRRRHVVPKNGRTPARRRAQGPFGTIAKAWIKVLTEEQRVAWNTAGAKVMSHPRLGWCDPLSGEIHFEGINCAPYP